MRRSRPASLVVALALLGLACAAEQVPGDPDPVAREEDGTGGGGTVLPLADVVWEAVDLAAPLHAISLEEDPEYYTAVWRDPSDRETMGMYNAFIDGADGGDGARVELGVAVGHGVQVSSFDVIPSEGSEGRYDWVSTTDGATSVMIPLFETSSFSGTDTTTPGVTFEIDLHQGAFDSYYRAQKVGESGETVHFSGVFRTYETDQPSKRRYELLTLGGGELVEELTAEKRSSVSGNEGVTNRHTFESTTGQRWDMVEFQPTTVTR